MPDIPMMNFGSRPGIRDLPCQNGHTWHPVAAEPGRPGYMRYHCQVCGEQASFKQNGEESPEARFERRLAYLEREVADLRARIPRDDP